MTALSEPSAIGGLRYHLDQLGLRVGPVHLITRTVKGFAAPSQMTIEEQLFEAFGQAFDCTNLCRILDPLCRELNNSMYGKVALVVRLLKAPPVIANEAWGSSSAIRPQHADVGGASKKGSLDMQRDNIGESADNKDVASSLLLFIKATKLGAAAAKHENTKAQEKASIALRHAVTCLEKLTGSLDNLVPLLKHPDADVRVQACLMLIDDYYELVIPVLQLLDAESEAQASDTAAIALQMYGEPNVANSFTKPEPQRWPQPRKRPWD